MQDIKLENDIILIVMVRPFSFVNGQIFVNAFNKFLTTSFCPPCNTTACPEYDYLYGGDGWVVVDDERNYTNSIEQANAIVDDLLLNHVFKLNEIKIVQKFNTDGMMKAIF